MASAKKSPNEDHATEAALVAALHDRMTEQRYIEPISSFELAVRQQGWREIDVLNQGTAALAALSQELGLAFDGEDLVYYANLFGKTLKRNPTSVECFDLAQSNSEHSRHWFFKVRTRVLSTSSHSFFCTFFFLFPITLSFLL